MWIVFCLQYKILTFLHREQCQASPTASPQLDNVPVRRLVVQISTRLSFLVHTHPFLPLTSFAFLVKSKRGLDVCEPRMKVKAHRSSVCNCHTMHLDFQIYAICLLIFEKRPSGFSLYQIYYIQYNRTEKKPTKRKISTSPLDKP